MPETSWETPIMRAAVPNWSALVLSCGGEMASHDCRTVGRVGERHLEQSGLTGKVIKFHIVL